MSLKTMISDRGLKQGWIASQLGLGESHFSEIVRGIKNMPAAKVLPLAKLLDVPAEVVLHEITPQKPEA